MEFCSAPFLYFDGIHYIQDVNFMADRIPQERFSRLYNTRLASNCAGVSNRL